MWKRTFDTLLAIALCACVGGLVDVIGGSMDIQTTNYWETYMEEPHVADQRNAIKIESFKWPNGTVPFIFDDSYTAKNRAAVLDGMEIFRQQTCARFVPKSDAHVEHIRFVKGAGCGANVGYRKNRKDPLDVMYSEYCLTIRGAIQHEMFHVLGLLHEQSRPDRDDYIDIFWENIDKRYYANFRKAGYDIADTFDLPYDYNSLMHYPSNAFAKSNRNVTIASKQNASQPLGQNDGPTFNDLEKIRRMYNCN